MNTTQRYSYRNHRFCSLLTIATLALALLLTTHNAAHTLEPVTPKYASSQIDLNNPDRVDIALVLAVDVSSSIETNERRFQREAYAQALSDPRVANLALGGGSGRVAIAYMEWSGRNHQKVHLPMRVMSSPQELAAFAAEILAIPDHEADPMYVQPTAIGNALLAAETAMAQLQVPAREYVIDISGDGVMNDGTDVDAVRAHLIGLGLTVNGLPIEVSIEMPRFEDLRPAEVSQYYADCVIGGPGAFHVVARGFGDVRETLIMKLMLEMAQMPAADKRRIAAAWNNTGGTARIIPATATVLNIAPPQPDHAPQANCDAPRTPGINPFQIIP